MVKVSQIMLKLDLKQNVSTIACIKYIQNVYIKSRLRLALLDVIPFPAEQSGRTCISRTSTEDGPMAKPCALFICQVA